MKGRRRCLVSVSLVESWLRVGCLAFEPAEDIPTDIELVEVEWNADFKWRGVVAMVFASEKWPEGPVVDWNPAFKRKEA
jgi:hypothetical protein